MTIKEIEAEIQRLQNLRDELSKQEIAEFKEHARDNVGRCFIVNGRYVKVIGIPQEHWQLSGRPNLISTNIQHCILDTTKRIT